MDAVAAARTRPGHGHPRLAALIFAFDRWLQRRHHLFEFSDHPDCIFRIQLAAARHDARLSDGTCVRRGDRLIVLHFWNEHIPLLRRCGASIGWAHAMRRATALSLRELARYLELHPQLRDVAAARGDSRWSTSDQARQFASVCGRMGFEIVCGALPPTKLARLSRLAENLLVSLLVLARNPAALRRDSLRREHTLVYLSRKQLESRYGSKRAG